MQEINLLQTKVRDTSQAWENQARFVFIILSIVLVLLAAGGAGLYLLKKNVDKQNDALIIEQTQLKSDLANKEKNLTGAKAFQAQLINIKTLIANHIYFSSLLDELAKFTYQKSKYASVEIIQNNGLIRLQGNASNYSDLSKFILGLSTSTNFTDVKLHSITPSTGKDNVYLFSLDVTAKPNLFKK